MNLVEGLSQELVRCAGLEAQYKALGPVGAFGALMIRDAINTALAAQAGGDIAEMMAAYQNLKDCE